MRRVLRIGHRGAAGHAPENTLAAIEKGIDLRVDFVEIDLRRTADGALVVLHDSSVNRTTNGRGRIDRLSLNEVRKLDAGNGERIPTLAMRVDAGDQGQRHRSAGCRNGTGGRVQRPCHLCIFPARRVEGSSSRRSQSRSHGALQPVAPGACCLCHEI
ncbi:MAG: hypothetical protein HP490_00260 [Nitrospira sp.]|nr:hypothetical protein [Nitrospira sp.]